MSSSVVRPLRPIGMLGSLLYFGIPAGLFSASLLGLLPWMVRQGYDGVVVFSVTFAAPLALMLVAALVAYRLEGHPWTWEAFRDRMRLRKLTGRDWLWTIALVAVSLAGASLLSSLAEPLHAFKLYNAPAEFSTFMGDMQRGVLSGASLEGRWLVGLWLVMGLVVFNIGGEELWWRGIILPRQELAFGKWAWLVNGVLWDLFHIFYHTTLGGIVAYLPITVPLAYVAQRTGSTWPGIIGHLATNISFAIFVIRAVIG
ncbi:MAG: CPBP family intramembrane glutamic endopeptidase [Gemmatimonadales bacterium]